MKQTKKSTPKNKMASFADAADRNVSTSLRHLHSIRLEFKLP